jgi:hypothetical protein
VKGEGAATPLQLRGGARPIATSTLLVSHSVLVGLTPLIPVPLVDDYVKAFLERRLARAIAGSHGVALTDEEVRTLGEGPGRNLLAEMGRGVILLPLRLLLRKVFLFLNVKRASDAASAAYHRGYLLDVALAANAHPPRRAATAVRAAIDATLEASPHSPIGGAVRLSFEGSKGLLRQALSVLIGALRRMGGAPSEVELEQAVEGAEERDAFASLVSRVRQSVETVPAAYFQEIEERLLAQLARPVPAGVPAVD